MAQDLIRRVLMKIDKNYLPYEYFKKLITFKSVEVFEGVIMTKMPSHIGLYFHSTMREGTEIIEHYHNAREYSYITKGKILLKGGKEYKKGDEVVFEPFELHNIKVLEDCEMYIQFIKDESFKKIR